MVCLQGRMELNNASVNNVDDTDKNAFEITGILLWKLLHGIASVVKCARSAL
jgi:hypothetical protein